MRVFSSSGRTRVGLRCTIGTLIQLHARKETNMSMCARVDRALFGVLLWLSLNACGGAPPTTTAAAPLVDDFTATECLFGSLEGTASRGYGCIDGEFRAWIDNDQEAYDFVSASAGESYGDVSIEVDVRFVSGEDAGAYLFCRGGEHTGDFYAFRVGVDGIVEITDYLGGEEQIARLFQLEVRATCSSTSAMTAPSTLWRTRLA